VNNSNRTAKKTPHFAITKMNWLTMFKVITALYTENGTKTIQNEELLMVEVGGTYSYHWALKG
jgi:hypothetical protein